MVGKEKNSNINTRTTLDNSYLVYSCITPENDPVFNLNPSQYLGLKHGNGMLGWGSYVDYYVEDAMMVILC